MSISVPFGTWETNALSSSTEITIHTTKMRIIPTRRGVGLLVEQTLEQRREHISLVAGNASRAGDVVFRGRLFLQ